MTRSKSLMRRPPDEPEQPDLFFCDIQDISIKDSRETMVFPFLSLQKTPRHKAMRYEAVHTDATGKKRTDVVTVTSNDIHGIATIWDFDIMLWIFGQLAAILNDGEKPPQRFAFHAYDCMKGIQRTDHKDGVGGDHYKRFEAALYRLRSTIIWTNLAGGSVSQSVAWLEDLIIRRDAKDRVQHVEVKLHDWIYDKVIDPKSILTLNKTYFLITGAVPRQLYRFARKMAGEGSFGLTLSELADRSGAEDRKHFVQSVRKLADQVTSGGVEFPDYDVKLSSRNRAEFITFTKRKPRAQKPSATAIPPHRTFSIDDDSYDAAKRLCRDYDLDCEYWFNHWQEKQWVKHMDFIIQHGRPPLKHPGKAFLGYLQRVATNRSA
jgi:hypothetical protein